MIGFYQNKYPMAMIGQFSVMAALIGYEFKKTKLLVAIFLNFDQSSHNRTSNQSYILILTITRKQFHINSL